MTNQIENLTIYDLRIGMVVDTIETSGRPALWGQDVQGIYTMGMVNQVYLSPAERWVGIDNLRRHKPKPKEEWKVGDKVNAFLKSDEHDVSEKSCVGGRIVSLGTDFATVEGVWADWGTRGGKQGSYLIPVNDITLVESCVPKERLFKAGDLVSGRSLGFHTCLCGVVAETPVDEYKGLVYVIGIWEDGIYATRFCYPDEITLIYKEGPTKEPSNVPVADGAAVPRLDTKINPSDQRHPVSNEAGTSGTPSGWKVGDIVGAKKGAFFNAGRCRRGEIVDLGSSFEGEQTYDVRGVWDGSPTKDLGKWFVKQSDLCEPEPESQTTVADGCADPGLDTKINPNSYRHPLAEEEPTEEEEPYLTSVEKLLGANDPVTNFDYSIFKNCAKPITEGGKALETKYSRGIAAMGKPDGKPSVPGLAKQIHTNTHTGPDFTTIEQLLNVIIEELRGIAVSVSRTQQ